MAQKATKSNKPRARTKPQNRTRLKQAAFLRAYRANLGNVTLATKAVKIDRATFYKWTRDDSEFAAKVENLVEEIYDQVENQIIERTRESDQVLMFFARTKMKHRGYQERTDINLVEQPAFVISQDQKGAQKVLKMIHSKNAKTG